jgi:hypothetical protein
MLIGAGVSGGQVIGGLDDSYIGEPVDLATGERTENGTALQSSHFGATLMALGDVDPGEVLPGFEPITAAIR